MYLVIIEEYKKDVIINTIKVFKRRFIGYWLCILVNKIRGRKVEVIKE